MLDTMDDDVKNLFQRFGQSTDGYQEINRQTDSEQAKQRWPLLRDVHLHPSPIPVRVEEHDVVAPQRALAERQEVNLNQVSAPMRRASESEPVQAFSLNEMSSRPVGAKPLSDGKVPAQGLFSERPSTVSTPAVPARSLFANVEPAPSLATAPAAQFIPAAPAAVIKHGVDSVSPINGSGFLGGAGQQFNPVSTKAVEVTSADEDSKNHSIGSVFNRLAGKTEQAKPAESGVNSFFKKIFKP
ncbi:cellulose biosynthesis protein BcsP [Undibacterium sp. SXout7W]|uniref:cellulose biosynthesis protein BcsP n=1 Tax=Undibacterium sp. SXout7W TaxID=3413049 RepID=UPI003BF18F39